MIKYAPLLSFFIFFGSLQGSSMLPFASSHVPTRQDGKIDIPQTIKHIKLDIGLSYWAPMSQHWLSRESDLWVFAFEPNTHSVELLKNGATKLASDYGDPLDKSYIGKRLFIFPCALGLRSGELATFYVTSNDSSCSSLYEPVFFPIQNIMQVPVFRLSDFLDLIPFDTHPVIDYIKIDTQGADFDIVRSAGKYIEDRVVYITIEAQDAQYKGTMNSEASIDKHMKEAGFVRHVSPDVDDPTYFNTRFTDYVKTTPISIFQRG